MINDSPNMIISNFTYHKIDSLKIGILLFVLFISLALSNDYKEPPYTLVSKDKNIEIRRYSECIIARTSIEEGDSEMNNSMFRTLANYIFGGNEENKKIPMTTPVITRENSNLYDMIFFMLDVNDENELPKPLSDNVSIDRINLGKVVVIRFAWWASEKNIRKHKKIIQKYIDDNELEITSDMMIAQYNPPLSWPFSRRNELIFKIK